MSDVVSTFAQLQKGTYYKRADGGDFIYLVGTHVDHEPNVVSCKVWSLQLGICTNRKLTDYYFLHEGLKLISIPKHEAEAAIALGAP